MTGEPNALTQYGTAQSCGSLFPHTALWGRGMPKRSTCPLADVLWHPQKGLYQTLMFLLGWSDALDHTSQQPDLQLEADPPWASPCIHLLPVHLEFPYLEKEKTKHRTTRCEKKDFSLEWHFNASSVCWSNVAEFCCVSVFPTHTF